MEINIQIIIRDSDGKVFINDDELVAFCPIPDRKAVGEALADLADCWKPVQR